MEGMEADIYPRQCVTGSAKSAMMNVLAGINPQCTPPLPSSSAVPPPPSSYFHPLASPRPPSFPPLHGSSSCTLETRLFLSFPSSLAPFFVNFPLPPARLFLALSFAFAALRSFFFWTLHSARASLYRELPGHCSFFPTLSRRGSMPRIFP